jgi:outer membrane protein assembly factor BamB
MRLVMLYCVCAAVLFGQAMPAMSLAATPEAPWPTFRGPGRTAVSPDTGLLKQWPEEGPPLAWEAPGAGRGYSSLAIAGGRIFTLGDGSSLATDTDEYLLAFDQDGGKPLWMTKTGPRFEQRTANWESSRSTPTVDGERVYVLSPHGELVCCESATGNEVWRKNLKKDFNGKKADGWGYSESVLIDDERLICTPGGTATTMVALNKFTGEVVWKMSREGDRGAGHASIVVANVGGTKVYVQSTGSGPLGVRADDGKLLWTYDIEKTTAVIPTPIVRGDLVFFTAGYGRGGALLKQVPGEGGIKIEELYPLKRELGNKHGGVVLIGDYLYGDSEDKGVPFCAELMTGEIMWQQRGPGRGSAAVCAADGCIYFRFADGTVALVKATPESYQELGKFKAPGSGERPSWSHPVVVGGMLYLREGDRLLCYDVRAR